MTPPTRPISLVVITLNGARHLRDVLDSASCCAERLVLDSGSTDGTVAIAEAAAARVEHQPFLGYGRQKQRAVELATHDWILSLDDDEVLDPEAARAIAGVDLSDPFACRLFAGGSSAHRTTGAPRRLARLRPPCER